ncbi:GIY-YIG nuclease family protein [Lacinutrix sp. C3R15]|uniref:NUMOD1 domain-containing DNA-binding protein n=1 Tax=Flavobacteriaceae TaxID=49546 RepID=UPI001C0A617E|nr:MULTISPECIES: NUMOD1 domain-containing DNA-binding protein [Flavobacteriaceae]MBU2940162.1 GIY-YIG nuclease family protein [Lacinutrix sp. C3R15]MDO6623479.1 NUMOD1 domain-containing DNA-binding protein [Oceanihabitans sp. 1_MG-2023]
MKIIYKVTNKTTGSAYIGATTRSLEERKQDHFKKVSNNSEKPLHKAISTYGVDAFTWETIDKASTNNELAEKEVNYIFSYSNETELYNQDRGGGIPKQVYQYNMETGMLINTYNSLTEAGEQFGMDKKALSKVCLSVNKTFNNFYWSYKYKEPFKPLIDARNKSVTQYDDSEKELKTFKSVSEASKQTGVNKTSIAKVCRGERKSAGGFLWRFK